MAATEGRKKEYQTPKLVIVSFCIEQGFAGSNFHSMTGGISNYSHGGDIGMDNESRSSIFDYSFGGDHRF